MYLIHDIIGIPVKNIWQALKKPIFALAPMEDVTDTVFRQMVAKYGKPDLFFTEFTNVDGLNSKGRDKVINRLQYTWVERPIIAQIWGKEPENFYKSALEIAQMGFDGIDLNMGCPEKAVIKHGVGGALILNPQKAKEIILATKEGAKGLPLSVKTRIGYQKIQTEEWIGFLLEQNLDGLTIHGRTVAEMSDVPAHWEEIAKVVELKDKIDKKTIILGNGDVKSYQEGLEKCQKFGVDGVMIGRGIFENLFIFNPDQSPVSLSERLKILLEHTKLYQKTWGETKNFEILKKYYKIYLWGVEGAATLRKRFMEAKSISEVEEIIISSLGQQKIPQ